MDKNTLLANYRDAFTRRGKEIANLVDSTFLSSSSVVNINIFSREEFDFLGNLIPPEQNAACVELLRKANNLEKFTKFSAALLDRPSTKERAEKLFPFVKDAPRELHPSHRMWELRSKREHKVEKKPDLLLLTTNWREFECVVRSCSELKKEKAKEIEEIWGDVNIFNLSLPQGNGRRVVVLRIWETRFLRGVLGTFAPRMAILSLSCHANPLPRMERYGRIWKSGDCVLVESLQIGESCLRAHQRVHELKLWNLKWESERRGLQETIVSHSQELELLSQKCQTLSFKKVCQATPHPLYLLPHPQATLLQLHFAAFERIVSVAGSEAEGIQEWVDEFYRTAEQSRPRDKRGVVGDMPVFFCLVTLKKTAGKEDIEGESEEQSPPLMFQLIHKLLQYFFIDAKQPSPS